MRKTLIFLVSSVLFLSACSNEDSSKVTLMLDYTPNTNHTGIYVAKELGYYKDVGIDLEILQPGDTAPNAAVASQSVDFGVSYGEDVAMYNQVDDYQITSIMSILSTNTSGIVSAKTSGITRPRDFEGKTYCGWGSEMETALIKSLVEADGGDFSKVNMMVATPNLTSENNECDLAWTYEAWDNIMMSQKGIEYNYIPFTNYTVDWYTPIIITSKKMIETDPKLVSDFVSATIKGYEYATNNPRESADILLKAVPELDSELVYESQNYISNYYADSQGRIGYQEPKVWDSFVNWMVENEIVDSQLKSDELYTNEYLN